MEEQKSIASKGIYASISLGGTLPYAIIFIFLAWCVIAFWTDIAKINFAPVWAAKEAVIIAALLSLFNYALRIARWALYLSRLGPAHPPGFTALTYLAGFAFTLSPGKVGEMIRGRYYQKLGTPLSATAAAFFVERLMDLLSMIALVFLAVSVFSDYGTLIFSAVALIVILLAVLACAPWERVAQWLETSHSFPGNLDRALQGVLHTLINARKLLTLPILATGFGIGLIAWGAEGIGLMVIGAIFPGVPIDWATATGIYSVAIIVGALSFLPGGLGSTEAVMIALLAAHGYPMSDAIVLTLVCRLLTLWLAVGIGWIAVAMLRHHALLKKVAHDSN